MAPSSLVCGLTRRSTRTSRMRGFARAAGRRLACFVGPHGTGNRWSLVRRHACVSAFGGAGSVPLVAVRWRTGRRVVRCCRRWPQPLVSGQPVIGARAAAEPRSAGCSLRCTGAGSTVHSRTATSSVGADARTSAAASSVGPFACCGRPRYGAPLCVASSCLPPPCGPTRRSTRTPRLRHCVSAVGSPVNLLR